MDRTAVISQCGKFRYRLGRRWGDGPVLVFIMLNPSTADHTKDDPTITRCVGFASDHGCQAIEVVNLFAYRATDPADLKRAGYPVGPTNDEHILAACFTPRLLGVCAAWGANARGLPRVAELEAMATLWGIDLHALALTADGVPRHPLMLASKCRLTPYRTNAQT